MFACHTSSHTAFFTCAAPGYCAVSAAVVSELESWCVVNLAEGHSPGVLKIAAGAQLPISVLCLSFITLSSCRRAHKS